MIKKAIAKVVEREHLTEGEMIEVMNQIMSGECTPAQIGAFITALRMKGETVEEITGARRNRVYRYSPYLALFADHAPKIDAADVFVGDVFGVEHGIAGDATSAARAPRPPDR